MISILLVSLLSTSYQDRDIFVIQNSDEVLANLTNRISILADLFQSTDTENVDSFRSSLERPGKKK